MGVGGVFKFFLRRFFEIFVIAAILVLVPNLPPKANFSKQVKVPPPKPLTGKLALNNGLDDVEVWHKGDFTGPEAFADLNGVLYTSLYTGDIVKLIGEHIVPVVKFGKPCKGATEESICGRPLGIEFDKDGRLYAADSYYGIFRVNVNTGDKEQLVGPNTEIDGKVPRIFNSLALASNGDIYWTDSSTEFSLEDGLFSFFSDPTGRLIHYDAKTKKNKVLIDGLHFANGVALSQDEEFVIAAETVGSRIFRYYLKGPKKGKTDVFIDGLPGLPDNLKGDGKGGFLVPLVVSSDSDHPALFQSIAPFPLVRKAIARFMGVVQYVFEKIDELYPNEISVKVVHYIGHFSNTPSFLMPKRVTILRVNAKGEITDSAHSLAGKISRIAEMHVLKDTLYLGSPFNDYIAKIPLAKLGWEDLRKDERVKRETPTTTTTTPKPATTTTPRPTTTTQRQTTTTTTTQKPTTTTTQKPTTTTTQKPTTTTPKPTTPKPTTTTQKAPQQQVRKEAPPTQQAKPTPQQQQQQQPRKQAPPTQQTPAPKPAAAKQK